MRGKVSRIHLVVEFDMNDGTKTRMEIDGQSAGIYGRRPVMKFTPHYGNPGEGPTQVEVQIDSMVIPLGHRQLYSMVDYPAEQRALEAETAPPSTMLMIVKEGSGDRPVFAGSSTDEGDD